MKKEIREKMKDAYAKRHKRLIDFRSLVELKLTS